MSEAAERPLVTFVVIAYNQERFIREAVEGAFAQTYEPLEIILSDDCSPDRTFEIMQEMAAGYDGLHRVRLNRNERNLGLAAHLNIIEGLTSSEVIILAAGDDVSLPDRAKVIASTFKKNPALAAIFSEVALHHGDPRLDQKPDISIELLSLKTILYYGGGAGIGAGYAYRRECFKWPWPLPNNIFSEDRILPLRGALRGQVGRIRHPFVLYRKRDAGLFSRIRSEGKTAIVYPPHVLEVERTLEAAEGAGIVPPWVISDAKKFFRWRHRLARMTQRRGRYGDGFIRVLGRAMDVFSNGRYRLNKPDRAKASVGERLIGKIKAFQGA